MGSVPTVRETNPEAFRLYLQGSHLAAQQDSSKNALAESLFRQALALDSQYMPAWRELNRVLAREIGSRDSVIEDIANARSALDRALEIEPNDAASLAYRAYEIMRYDGNYVQAAREFERAIRIDPTNENVLRSAAMFTIAFAQVEDAVAFSRHTVEHNPLCFFCQGHLYNAQLLAGNFTEAETVARTMLSLFGGTSSRIGEVLLQTSQPEAAINVFEKLESEAERLFWTALAYYDMDQTNEFEEAATAYLDLIGRRPWNIARLYAYTNQIDAAFDAIGKAEEETLITVDGAEIQWNYYTFAGNARGYFLQNLHQDPRWNALLEKNNVSEDQLAGIEFNPRF